MTNLSGSLSKEAVRSTKIKFSEYLWLSSLLVLFCVSGIVFLFRETRFVTLEEQLRQQKSRVHSTTDLSASSTDGGGNGNGTDSSASCTDGGGNNYGNVGGNNDGNVGGNNDGNVGGINDDIVLMVMGEAKNFKVWFDRIIQFDIPVTYIYASYDVLVNDTDGDCINEYNGIATDAVVSQQQQQRRNCQSIFIPNTTWTEGRNLLAEAVVRLENERGSGGRGGEFDHWIFVDDDILLYCGDNFEQIVCWDVLLNFIVHDMPQNAVGVGLSGRREHMTYASFSTFDAIYTSLKRRYVPYLMPYPVLEKGDSWWLSQAMMFQLFQKCFPRAFVAPPVLARNPSHRGYPEGHDPNKVVDLMHNNYDNYTKLQYNAEMPDQLVHLEIFHTPLTLAKYGVPLLNYSLCKPFAQRYTDWESQILTK